MFEVCEFLSIPEFIFVYWARNVTFYLALISCPKAQLFMLIFIYIRDVY